MEIKGGLKVGVKIERPAEERTPVFILMLLFLSLILISLTLVMLSVELFNFPVPNFFKF